MSQDLERDLRNRFQGARLPAAPVVLHERVRSVSSSEIQARGWTADVRWLVPLVAVLVIAVAAIVSSGGQPSPTAPATDAAAQEPAGLGVDSRVYESCGPLGCAYFIELDGPGGPWRGELEYGDFGQPRAMEPMLPVTLSPGHYTMRAEIHVLSDALEPGESEGKDLGTPATCSTEFSVAEDAGSIAASIGFWLDRCSVGIVASGESAALSSLTLEPRIDGRCGDPGGCEYRVLLTGESGSWQGVLRTPKPAGQLAIGTTIPSFLPAGPYRLEGSSHRMSADAEPGAGHQQELGAASVCSADVVIDDSVGSVELRPVFHDETCSVEVVTTARPEPTPTATDPDMGPESREQVFGPAYPDRPAGAAGPRIDEASVSSDGLALTLRFTGAAPYQFTNPCSKDYEPWVARQSGALVVGIYEVAGPRSTLPPPSNGVAHACGAVGYVHTYHLLLPQPITDSVVYDANGDALTMERASQPAEIVCEEGEPPAYTCAEVINAVFRAVGWDRAPIERVDVQKLCRTRDPCTPMASVIVEVTFREPAARLERLIVNPGSNGLTATFIERQPGESGPPQLYPSPEPFEQRFEMAYGRPVPSGTAEKLSEVRITKDRETLTVTFWAGGGYSGGPCSPVDHQPWIEMKAGELRVGILGISKPTWTFPPDAIYGCVLPAYRHTYHLVLPEPYLGSTVRNLDGEAFDVGAP